MLARICKLDLSQPGAVDDLLALHQSIFGNLRMEDDADGDADDDGSDGDDKGKDDKRKSGKEGDDDKDGDLGDKGKKALDDERTARRKAERAAKPWQKLAKELNLTPEQARAALTKAGKSKPNKDDSNDEDEIDVEEIRKQARAEAEAESARERALDKVEAKAAAKFQDPDLVRGYLRDQVEDFIDTDNKIDFDAIEDALKVLLEKRPHLARDAKKTPKKDPSQGARPGEGKPSVAAGKEMFEARRPKATTS